MYKCSKILIIIITLLTGCTNIEYQQRNEYTPDGYSESKLENGNYLVVYETYKKAGNRVSLEELALKRASELTKGENKSYFDVVSNAYEEYEDRLVIPEYITFAASNGKSRKASGYIPKEYEIIVPAHIKTFNIKKLSLTISLLDEKSQSSLFVPDYLK